MSMIYSIYKAVNLVNGKVYIGFTKNWPSRKTAHRHQHTSSPMKFHCALRKYGWDMFEWSVIFQSWDYDFCLNHMEPHFIREYNSMDAGYNNNRGGGNPQGPRGRAKTTEHKQKLAQALRGRKQSVETCAKKSASFKGRKQNKLWVESRVRHTRGMVAVVNKDGVTSYISVEEYKQQYNGCESLWCTTRSTEGKRRLAGDKNV